MEIMAWSIGGAFSILMLIGGITLTVITVLRMCSGKIALPTWGKLLLCVAMITLLAIQIAGMLPVRELPLDQSFGGENTLIADSTVAESIQTTP